MQRFFNLMVGGLALWASTASAVSVIGGGTLSNEEVGFFCAIPAGYEQFHIARDQDVRMDAQPQIRAGVLVPRFLIVSLLANERPDWVGKTDRAEFAAFYSAAGWTRIPHTEPCVEQWEKFGSGSITRLLSWGDGRGAVFVAPSAYQDASSAASSLRLVPGACSWR